MRTTYGSILRYVGGGTGRGDTGEEDMSVYVGCTEERRVSMSRAGMLSEEECVDIFTIVFGRRAECLLRS